MSEREASLSTAFAAYAEVTSGQALNSGLVRARILQSARVPRRRSLRRLSFALPLVAVLAASAAFAASRPALRAAIRASFQTLLGQAAAPSQAPPQHRARRGVAPSASAQAATPAASVKAEPDLAAQPPIAIDALPLAPRAGSSSGAELHGAPRPAGAAAAASAKAEPSEGDAELGAYRSAHRLHFDGAGPAAALAAWDRYLADFPAGSFADDARFNRALCLIRLGRLADARSALTPFAAAPSGSYRQTEAASLLQGLGAAGLRSSK
jgi:hypothetical protein